MTTINKIIQEKSKSNIIFTILTIMLEILENRNQKKKKLTSSKKLVVWHAKKGGRKKMFC